MKNRLGLNYLRPEYEGMMQEKEDSKLEMQDKKNKLVMEQHDLSMIRLQNNELRRKIGQLGLDNKEIDHKRIKTGKELDQAYQQLFIQNESLKLFNKTLL